MCLTKNVYKNKTPAPKYWGKNHEFPAEGVKWPVKRRCSVA
ncbi:hypothetical protein B4114_0188 [Geobacillus stearothermophilus]|uniref:Uncharacterized protein n=1 Tax=Geobacillus stearothermophilus TaxID=1422 RepID=A0A150N4B1_GEOSE|nr:hypothetical protein B4114_0188 [Geobacillus stearothermophilus]